MVSVPFLSNKYKNQQGITFRVNLTLGLLMFLGFVCILLINSYAFWGCQITVHDKVINFLEVIGIDLIVAGAAYMIGGALGFLFGIPRIVQPNNAALLPPDKTQVLQNDNLLQVSDWLTKILVGVGLTQLTSAPHFLNATCTKISASINIGLIGANATVLAGIIIFYWVAGFATCYLWTRVYFTRLLKIESSDNDGDGEEDGNDNKQNMEV